MLDRSTRMQGRPHSAYNTSNGALRSVAIGHDGRPEMRTKVLFILGTRPEAIKLCPVIRCLRSRPEHFAVRVCVTAQHRDMLDQVLKIFEVDSDWDLDIMQPGQTLIQSASRILSKLETVLVAETPDMLLVQGDTTTTFCGALAGFYSGVPVGHVEAGLRTGDVRRPFPEEMNRILTSRLALLHFAATERAAENLRSEGVVASRIFVTGNPGIDAVLYIRDALAQGRLRSQNWHSLDPMKKLILVTAHRRESFGEGLRQICEALLRLSKRDDVQIVYPTHPNPNVSGPVESKLRGRQNILLLGPIDYLSFVDLMRRSYFVLTDSGGIQEEAPSLGKPVLVMREATERQEAIEAGTSRLVGTDPGEIVTESARLLDEPEVYARMRTIQNPYGDGRASGRIGDAILASQES